MIIKWIAKSDKRIRRWQNCWAIGFICLLCVVGYKAFTQETQNYMTAATIVNYLDSQNKIQHGHMAEIIDHEMQIKWDKDMADEGRSDE